jgi:hypothetical protein
MTKRQVHDIGGLPAAPFLPSEEPWLFWEKQAEAIRNLLGENSRRLATLDEIRRGFETLGEDMYGQLTFYERRLESLLRILVEKGVIKREDLEARVAAMREEAKGK